MCPGSRSQVVLPLLIICLLLSGCSFSGSKAPTTGNGRLLVTVQVPSPPVGDPKPLSLRSPIVRLDGYLLSECPTETATAPVIGSSATLDFGEVPLGEWKLRVDAVDERGIITYWATKDSVVVQARQTTTVNLALGQTYAEIPVDVDLTAMVQNGYRFGRIELWRNNGSGDVKECTLTFNLATAHATGYSYTNGTNWVWVKVYDQANTLLWTSDQYRVDTYPGETTATLSIMAPGLTPVPGFVDVSTTWNIVPDPPSGVTASIPSAGILQVTFTASPDQGMQGWNGYELWQSMSVSGPLAPATWSYAVSGTQISGLVPDQLKGKTCRFAVVAKANEVGSNLSNIASVAVF